MKAVKNNFTYVDQRVVDESGLKKEVVILKEWGDGSYSYIETQLLDKVDKARIRAILASPHAGMYEGYQLFAQTKLSNNLNGLDYFHQYAKIKNVAGSVQRSVGGSIFDSREVGGVGAHSAAGFADPNEVSFG